MPYDHDTKYSGDLVKTMTSAQHHTAEMGHDGWQKLLGEVREDQAKRDTYRAERDAEHAKFDSENPELVAKWENEGPWDGPTQAQEDAYNERYGGWGDEPTVDYVCIGGESYYRGQDYDLNDHADHADTDGS